MIKNTKISLVYKIIILLILFTGILNNFGVFTGKPNNIFYLYYTNLSNYVIFIVTLIHIIFIIKPIKNLDTFYKIKLFSTVWILITFLIYNLLLADPIDIYFKSIGNICFHLFGPLLFILDLFLFTPKININYKDTPIVVTFPYIYLAFILIRGAILKDTDNLLYPYFFINVTNLGYPTVFLWIIGLSIIFIGLAILFIKLKKKNNNA